MEQRPSRRPEWSAHDEVLDIKDEVHYVHTGKRRTVRWRLVAQLIVLVVGPTIIDLALGNPIRRWRDPRHWSRAATLTASPVTTGRSGLTSLGAMTSPVLTPMRSANWMP